MIIVLISISYTKCISDNYFYNNGYIENYSLTLKYIFTYSYYVLLYSCFIVSAFFTNIFAVLINERTFLYIEVYQIQSLLVLN